MFGVEANFIIAMAVRWCPDLSPSDSFPFWHQVLRHPWGRTAGSFLWDLSHVPWKILARVNLGWDRPDLNEGWAPDWCSGHPWLGGLSPAFPMLLPLLQYHAFSGPAVWSLYPRGLPWPSPALRLLNTLNAFRSYTSVILIACLVNSLPLE